MKITTCSLIFLLLFAVACNFSHNHKDSQFQNTITPFSLLQSTENANLDSLLQLAATSLPDTNLAYLYFDIGTILEDSEFEKAKEYFLKLNHLSEQLDWNKGRYLYAGAFANILIREGFADSAVVILQSAIDMAKHLNNEVWTSSLILSEGNAYFIKDWYETALSCYMEALPVIERRNDLKCLENIYYMMSQLYREINAIEKAIIYGEKAIALNAEDPFAFFALAYAYSSANQQEKAKGYYEEALRLSTLQDNIYIKGAIYYLLGKDALMVFDLERAEQYAQQALEINQQFGAGSYVSDLILLSKVELAKSNYDKSEDYIREALQIAIELDELKEKWYCYMILSELAVAQNKFRENMQYWNELNTIENAIAIKTTLSAAEEMQAKYETEKKELEIERQHSVIARANLQRWLLAAGIAIFAIIAVLLWNMLRLRNRSNRTLDERNHALDEMNATKDKFFSIISHDLKNPAVAQRDAIRILFDQAAQWDTASLHDYYGKLLRSADHHVELLYELLGWAQLQTKRMTCEPKPFDFELELRSDLALTTKMAEDKGVGMVAEIPPDTVITADAGMITTVVRNLLTNAVKFTSSGGTVTLSVVAAPNGKFTISVTDTGVGMTDEERQNIFRIDRQHTRRGTSGETGTGLGLIVCRELLEKHETTLHIESEVNKGSRFWFEL